MRRPRGFLEYKEMNPKSWLCWFGFHDWYAIAIARWVRDSTTNPHAIDRVCLRCAFRDNQIAGKAARDAASKRIDDARRAIATVLIERAA